MKKLISIISSIAFALIFLSGCGSVCEHEYLVDEHPSTHLEEGYYKYVCCLCGDTYYVAIPKTGHEWKYSYSKNDPSHHTKTCICGDTVVEDHTGVVTGHKTGVHVDLEYDVLTCVCGYSWNEGGINDDHVFSYIIVDEYRHKALCECGYEEVKEHRFDQEQIKKQPTKDEEGLVTRTCTSCGYYKDEVLEKLHGDVIYTPWD